MIESNEQKEQQKSTQKRKKKATMCMVIRFKFNIKPLFVRQNRQFFAQNWTSFFDRKCLTRGNYP